MKFRSRTERRQGQRIGLGLVLGLPVLALHVLALEMWPKVDAVERRPATLAQPGGTVLVRTVAARIPQAAISPENTHAMPARAPFPNASPNAAPPTAVTQAEPAAPPSPFLPASGLDRRPTPVSAPDPRWLDALANQTGSGLPLRLRLFITAAGEVVDVEPVQVSELDGFALPALQAMFRDTAFLPGRVQGRDVASQMELEIQLDGQTP
ncbi:hypothetical protein [uncultured Sphaerotilus sp.]|uniref:hypothetical protein n=1 Tax=uncultured Sphaerotilus sp. TaxID=474984 RepID=UPI0030CA2B2F